MACRTIVAGALMVAGALPQIARAGDEDPSSNAALQYWQAFALMPASDEEVFSYPRTHPVDDKIRALVRRSEPAMKLLHRGVGLKRCDWGLNVEQGPKTPLPHLSKARQLVRVAFLRTRVYFHDGRSGDAFDDLAATMTLARHVGQDPYIMSLVVQFMLEKTAIRAAAANLIGQKRETLLALRGRLNALPASSTAREVYLREKEVFVGWLRRRLEERGLEEALAGLRWLLGSADDPDEAVRAITRGKENLAAWLDETDAFYDEIADLAALPLHRFGLALKAFQEKVNNANPLAKGMLQNLGRFRYAAAAGDVRLAVLKAAIDVVLDGPKALEHHKDPFDGGPLAYKPAEGGGFALRSRLTVPEKGPVTVIAGMAPNRPGKAGASRAADVGRVTPSPSLTARGDRSPNAALQYWLAFALMAPESQFDNDDYVTAPLDDKTRRLMDQSDVVFRFVRRGAAMKRCDWGLNVADGPGMYLPHLAKARQLARFANLHARIRFADGRDREALEDLAATISMARHMGQDRFLVSLLVQYLVERAVVDTVSANLLGRDREALEALQSPLRQLPPSATMKQAILAEKEIYLGWFRRELNRLGPKEVRRVLLALVALDGKSIAVAEEFVGKTKEEQRQFLDEAAVLYDELAELQPLSLEEFEPAVKAFEEKVAKANEFVRLIIPAVNRAWYTEAEARARLAMLRAAVDVVLDGKDSLAKHKDPFGEGPFEYRALEGGGFELKSKLVYPDKGPVTLTVGKPPQPVKME